MVMTLTPDEVTAQLQAAEAEKQENASYQPTPVTDALASHVRHCWDIAKWNRGTLVARFTDCLRRRKGEYSAQKLQAINSMGGSKIYMKITGAKCNAAKSWLVDIFAPAGDRPWTLKPTPVPDLPPDIEQRLMSEAVMGAMQLGVPLEQMQELIEKHTDRLKDELYSEAEKRAERMSKKIEDVLAEGDFREEFNAFIDDLVTYPSAIFKGPIYRRERRIKWIDIGQGNYEPQVNFEVNRQFRRVSPFDFYPSPACTGIDDDWVIERHRLTASDLTSMRGAAGYNNEGIAMALTQYRIGGLKEWIWGDGERLELEGKQQTQTTDTDLIDALEWCGKLSGRMLLDWGVNPATIDDEYEEYQVSVMIVGDYVIRAMVSPDPLAKNDYYKASWRPIPSSFWGEALPEQLKDCQDMCNSAARALANNMGIASGPMVYYYADRVAQGQDVTRLHPWKIFGVTESRMGSSAQPLGFFQPQSNANELLSIYERFTKYADDITGLPSYAYGSDQGAGAARTASGLSMLMNAASKGIKQVIRNVDLGIIEPLITKVNTHLMLDQSIDSDMKGDVQIRARGSDSLVHKEATQAMQQQFLAQTANPIDMQIIGLDGRRELLREAAKSLDVPVDRVVPSQDMVAMQQMQAAVEEQQSTDAAVQSQTGNQPPEQQNVI